MFSHYFKVGAGIIAAVAILVISYQQLKETAYTDKNSYELKVMFDNIQGLSAGNDVWLSGVKIGSVDVISLMEDGRAMLTLRIFKDKKILRGSKFSINAGFLQDKNLSIEKPVDATEPYEYYDPGETIEKTNSPATVSDLMTEAYTALSQMNQILSEVKTVVANDDIKQNIFNTTENIEKATAEAFEFVKIMKDTGMTSREDIQATLENIRILSEHLHETIAKVDSVIENADSIVGDQETKDNLKEMVRRLKVSAENVEKTTEAIKDLTTDPEVHEDLRETIKSTKKTMDHADKAVSSFTKMLDAINKTEFKPDFEFRYESREDLYHADMNVRIFPPNSDVFYMFGYDDLGEDKTTNLQFGVKGDKPDLWYRLGLKDGKLGMGFEYKLKNRIYYGDLADPNDLHLNLRVGKELYKNRYIIVGWESILNDDGLSFGFMQKY